MERYRRNKERGNHQAGPPALSKVRPGYPMGKKIKNNDLRDCRENTMIQDKRSKEAAQ